MALQTWKCLECGKEFNANEFNGCQGETKHKVAEKTYLLDDAPSDPGRSADKDGFFDDRRQGLTRICNMPPDKTVLVNGESRIVPGGYVEFVRGRFTTSDPEVQFYLDRKGGFCTEARWEEVWLSKNQVLAKREMELKAREQRLEQQQNELLASVKREKAGART